MGDAHRIPRSIDKKFSDSCFEALLRMDPSDLSRNLSSFYTRPAYQYTKAEVGGLK